MFPLAWWSLILSGSSLGAVPEDIPAVVLRRNLSASDWAEQIVRCLEQKGKKKKKKRTFSFKRTEKERKEEMTFAKFLKNQFVDSSSIYVERTFSPSAVLKLGYLWKLLTTVQVSEELSLLALTVCKNRIYPFIPLWRRTSEGGRGRMLFDLEDAYSDVVASAKSLYWCWKLEKNNSPKIHTVLTTTMVLCF